MVVCEALTSLGAFRFLFVASPGSRPAPSPSPRLACRPRVDQVVAAHLYETAIVGDNPPQCSISCSKRFEMGVGPH